MDNDGIETIAHNGDAGAQFDNDSDGMKVASGWVHSDDGLLVLDRNGNGKIDDGLEVFGDNTNLSDGSKAVHGFAALADFDKNNDGKIDAKDEIFNSLKVWRDFSGDGVSDSSELFSLSELGIKALNLNYTVSVR